MRILFDPAKLRVKRNWIRLGVLIFFLLLMPIAVVVAQSASHLYLPSVTGGANVAQLLRYDMADGSSSSDWKQLLALFAKYKIQLVHNASSLAIQIDTGDGKVRSLANIDCEGAGCGSDDSPHSANVPASSDPDDFQFVVDLEGSKQLAFTWQSPTQILVTFITNGQTVDTAVITCSTGTCKLTISPQDGLLTGTPTATATPTNTPTNTPPPGSTSTPTPTPTQTTMPPMEDPEDMHWHAPGAHGDRPFHEHGDAPPQWVIDAGYDPSFDHVANTPNENMAYFKHTGFKGWAGHFGNEDWYGIFHLDFNPGGHVNRFHSYQLWIRDPSGGVSHFHGWLDFGQGNNTGPNLVLGCSGDTSIRPIMAVPAHNCPVGFESWYARSGQASWMPDMGFNINPNYYGDGTPDPANPATWVPIDGAVHNQERRIEFAWYADRTNRRGEFYATQFGDIVSGPNDAKCGAQRSYGTRSYTIVCLKEYIAPTIQSISFPNNSVQRTFPANGVVLPN